MIDLNKPIDRRDVLKAAGLMGLGALAWYLATPFVPSPFDGRKKDILRWHVKGVSENIVNLETITEYTEIQEGENKETRVGITTGQGIIVGNYIFTANHIASYNGEFRFIEDLGNRFVPIDEKLSEVTRASPGISNNFEIPFNMFRDQETRRRMWFRGMPILENVIKDSQRDLAIFRLPESYPRSEYQVMVGDDDELRLFDELHMIGDPHDILHVPKTSYLGREGVIELPAGPYKTYNGKIFSRKVDPGESGSPVLNKNGELVGIMVALGLNAFGLFNPINWYMDEIAKYEATQKERSMEITIESPERNLGEVLVPE